MNTGKEASVSVVLDRIAKKKEAPITSVALAYVLHKGKTYNTPASNSHVPVPILTNMTIAPCVFPIVGGCKVSHLKGNIEALGLELSQEEIDEIETGYDFEIRFPHKFLRRDNKALQGLEDILFRKRMGPFDHVKRPQPIPPHQGSLDDF